MARSGARRVTHTPEVVVFDLGGVLCRFDPDARVHALAAASGWSESRVDDHIWGSGRDAEADAGALTEEQAFALASLDGALDRETVLRCWASAFTPDTAVLALVDRIVVRRALLTNNGPVVGRLLDGVLAPVAARCDPVLLSWRLGVTKPAREAFARAGRRIGVDAARIVFVDDTARNVAGARAAGWNAVQFVGADDLSGQLERRGVLATSG